jgi:murein DD-endopeptidase MepM/ murein hydrolase activator NlpD
MKHHSRRARPIAAMAACVALGMAIGWWLHATGGPQPASAPIEAARPPEPAPSAKGTARTALAARGGDLAVSGVSPVEHPVATTGLPIISAAPRGVEPGGAIEVLHRHDLRVPIDGVNIETLKGGFAERRSGDGGHSHEAVDILAPRNTPVHAIEDGTIAKLFDSNAGGHTIYQFDPTGRFCYYYAHLDHYAEGLHDGQLVAAGQVIGYVGTSGNAPAGTPHLHFAISELGADKRWWQGEALDPYLAYKK